MKYNFIAIFLIPLVLSCSNCKTSVANKNTGENINQKTPTSIVQNSSIVTAVVNEVKFNSETDYEIVVTVTEVEENNDKPVIAVKGNDYTLKPNFRYNGDKLSESEINTSLKKLGKISKGKTFKAEISLENLKGWFIQNVISID